MVAVVVAVVMVVVVRVVMLLLLLLLLVVVVVVVVMLMLMATVTENRFCGTKKLTFMRISSGNAECVKDRGNGTIPEDAS